MRAILVHETRHANGPNHTCAAGNDQTLAELGAWGTVYYYCRWTALPTGWRRLACGIQ